jgi:hypothetical protein
VHACDRDRYEGEGECQFSPIDAPPRCLTALIFRDGRCVGWARKRIFRPVENSSKCFTPFLTHFAASELSKRTIQRHVDDLWILGGEIIRDLNEDRLLSSMCGVILVPGVVPSCDNH